MPKYKMKLKKSDQEKEAPLGLCCNCEKRPATKVINLNRRSIRQTHSAGWGCSVCNLPEHGAFSVICESCLANKPVNLKKFVIGDAIDNDRADFSDLSTLPYQLHDLRIHAGYQDISWQTLTTFPDSPDRGQPTCACSLCGHLIAISHSIVRMKFDEKEIRLHDPCFGWLIKMGIPLK